MLNNDYMDAIQQAMVPAVLQKVIQAVNEMDPDACEQIMLPGLARQFGLGMDELRNDDSALHIEARNVRDVALEGLTLHVGPPAAFDTRVARTTRQSEYFYWSTGSSIHALDIGALRKGARKPKKTMAESLADPVSLHLNFCMTADIEMSRTKLGEVVDSDKGTMAVPLSLSTPTYPWLGSLPIVASGNKIIYSSDDLPPLEWRVSDVFRLVADKEFG
ncbi:hypothetical protein IWQ56_002518 [Coemansia nantahalensis]|nr:hypothetical protein IWQ56_002518 [Coemansia nantahalensis]